LFNDAGYTIFPLMQISSSRDQFNSLAERYSQSPVHRAGPSLPVLLDLAAATTSEVGKISPARDLMKAAQYEVLGNDAKRDVRPVGRSKDSAPSLAVPSVAKTSIYRPSGTGVV
jgi:hypothetical protein